MQDPITVSRLTAQSLGKFILLLILLFTKLTHIQSLENVFITLLLSDTILSFIL